jgi:hypothetical protein
MIRTSEQREDTVPPDTAAAKRDSCIGREVLRPPTISLFVSSNLKGRGKGLEVPIRLPVIHRQQNDLF